MFFCIFHVTVLYNLCKKQTTTTLQIIYFPPDLTTADRMWIVRDTPEPTNTTPACCGPASAAGRLPAKNNLHDIPTLVIKT